MPKTKTKERTYLTEEEKGVLLPLLEEWNQKADKKSKEAFISAAALPKIQSLDLARYGPEVISKDKAAKVLWERRVQAVFTWFKNNKPFKDRSVFKLERKIPLRRVVGKLRADKIHAMVLEKYPDTQKGDKRYPGLFQKATTDYMAQMDDRELEDMEAVLSEWQSQGPPMDVKLKAAKKYSRRGITNAHQILDKEMNVACVTFSFFPDPDTGVMAIFCHDYVADLHAKAHGKKFKTFKEWNGPSYSRLVQDMIGYANYVDQERKAEPEEPTSVPEPINFKKGPGSLPLLPEELKGVRGTEVAKHAKEIIRSYFLRHYQLASGSENSKTPWATIGQDPSRFFDPACLPTGFTFSDPSRMGANVKQLLSHLRNRQLEHGVNAFHFHHILQGNKLEPSNYPEGAQAAIAAGPAVKDWPVDAEPPSSKPGIDHPADLADGDTPPGSNPLSLPETNKGSTETEMAVDEPPHAKPAETESRPDGIWGGRAFSPNLPVTIPIGQSSDNHKDTIRPFEIDPSDSLMPPGSMATEAESQNRRDGGRFPQSPYHIPPVPAAWKPSHQLANPTWSAEQHSTESQSAGRSTDYETAWPVSISEPPDSKNIGSSQWVGDSEYPAGSTECWSRSGQFPFQQPPQGHWEFNPSGGNGLYPTYPGNQLYQNYPMPWGPAPPGFQMHPGNYGGRPFQTDSHIPAVDPRFHPAGHPGYTPTSHKSSNPGGSLPSDAGPSGQGAQIPPVNISINPPTWTPSTASPTKRTPSGKKRWRSNDDTPTRSGRVRRPTKRLLESQEFRT